uniref:Uncharacterized protein n=1 Tax=viral metagenome TaxID=1070528 RepID=A0A6C0DDS4_9ZZZZ
MALINKDIVDLQDIEKVQFLQSLQASPDKYSAYVNDKKGRILSEVVDTKRAAFVKASGDMARLMDMDQNSMAALNRTHDLTVTQDHIITQQAEYQNAAKKNLDMTRRQVEINNWYFENKRETLFVLQLLLLVMLTIIVTLGAQTAGWISTDAANYLMVFVVVIGLGTWLYRYWYTGNVRDARYWNKRRFGEDGNKKSVGELCIGYAEQTSGTM